MVIGAVIGDLAAWTWEHDRVCFYDRLVSPKSKLSGYGLLPIAMWPMINEGGSILKHRLYMTCGKALAHSRAAGVELPDDWYRWGLKDYDKAMPFDLKVALIMSAVIDSAYLSVERQKEVHWSSFFHGGKQEGYASILMTILRRLNEGSTKDDAIADIPEPVFNYYPAESAHPWRDLLEYTTFAWRCFYYSRDLRSALYNAAKCRANRHLAMMLTGAFADAMYGSLYYMTTANFGEQYEFIRIPTDIDPEYRETLKNIRKSNFQHFVKF